MSQVACRPTCVDRGAGAAAAVGSGRTLLDFSKPRRATDGAKESPVFMGSSSGGGTSGDVYVVATGVVNRGQGGVGAGSDADVVVYGSCDPRVRVVRARAISLMWLRREL